MEQQSSDFLERVTYQEAGHAVMFFLIDKGYTDDYIPFSRANILPAFTLLSVKEPRMNWGETAFSLGSLLTVPQVLLAGYFAERIKNKPQDNYFTLDSPIVTLALHLITCYVQEYGGNNMSIAKSQEIAAEQLKELGKHVNTSLRNHWSSVEALAAALLNHNTLSKDEVYGIIEKDIPLEERANAERRLKGDYLDSETRKWIEELRVKHLSKAKNKISDNSSDKEA